MILMNGTHGCLSIISMLDEMGITLALDQFEDIETIKDYRFSWYIRQ